MSYEDLIEKARLAFVEAREPVNENWPSSERPAGARTRAGIEAAWGVFERALPGAQLVTSPRIALLAHHQADEHLPHGIVCLCGEELPDLNPPLDDAAISGRALAMAVHQENHLRALATCVTASRDA